MSQFLGQLRLRSFSPSEIAEAGGGVALYELEEDFPYQSEKYGLYIAHKGLVTDFASIPKAAWSVIDPEDPRIQWPSVIHDAAYKSRGFCSRLSRQECDDMLREMMEVCGAGSIIRNAVYQSVRLFGGSHWEAA